MDPMEVLLKEIAAMGPEASGSIYKFPASVNSMIVSGAVGEYPGFAALKKEGKVKIIGAQGEIGSLLAIGGYVLPEHLEAVHRAVMRIDGVEHVVSAGPASGNLQNTAIGGDFAASRGGAKSSKPSWREDAALKGRFHKD